MRRLIFASLLAFGGFESSGCDRLISSDVTETPFALPSRMYSFDSSAFPVPSVLAQEVPCGAPPVVDCCSPTPPLPQPDCNMTPITCEQNENGMNVCMAQVTVSQSTTMNLGMEVPDLAGFTSIVNIKIKRIGYVVNANTLTVDLPDVDLYLAPSGVMDPMDSQAIHFGKLPGIPAMMMPSGDVILDSNAAGALSMFTQNIQTPFNFIAAAKPKVSKAPTGRIDMTVTGTLAASL